MAYYWFEISFIIGAYLLGSIPVGLILSKVTGTPNPRTHGSGNIGTTNMLRTGGKTIAFFTFFMDFLKGAVAVMLSYKYAPNLYQLAGMAAVIGHIFPIWLLFRGGKGVAVAFGVFMAWDFPLAFTCLVTWIAIVGTTRYVSAGSLAAALIAPIAAYYLHDRVYVLAILVITILIVISHRDNIKRLIAGKEPKIGDKADNNKRP